MKAFLRRIGLSLSGFLGEEENMNRLANVVLVPSVLIAACSLAVGQTITLQLGSASPVAYASLYAAIDAIPVDSSNTVSDAAIIRVGGTVIIDPIKIRVRGTELHRVRLQGVPDSQGNLAVIKLRPQSAPRSAGLEFEGAAFWHVSGIDYDGGWEVPSSDPTGRGFGGLVAHPRRLSLTAGNTYVPCHDLVFDNCRVHHCSAVGVQLDTCSNCRVINCDSFLNSDEHRDGVWGNHADGFQALYSDGTYEPYGCTEFNSSGHQFIGCRSYHNSDDGFDFWGSVRCLISHCEAHENGFPVRPIALSSFKGDGTGFKLGAGGSGHTVVACLASYNDLSGFTSNDAAGPCRFYNCTAYLNGAAVSSGVNAHSAVPNFRVGDSGSPHRHVVASNLSLRAVGSPADIVSVAVSVVDEFNAWNLDASTSASEFHAVPTTPYVATQRLPDGNLVPDIILEPLSASTFSRDGRVLGQPNTLLSTVSLVPEAHHLGAKLPYNPSTCGARLGLRLGVRVEDDYQIVRSLTVVVEGLDAPQLNFGLPTEVPANATCVDHIEGDDLAPAIATTAVPATSFVFRVPLTPYAPVGVQALPLGSGIGSFPVFIKTAF